jgi:hypothetical protein
MQYLRLYSKAITRVMVFCFGLASVYVPAAQAALVDTPDLLAADRERARVEAFMARRDVQQALTAQGVDVEQARQRIDALSDAEIREMAGRINELPAGGDIVGATVFVFLVLLCTDIMGLTEIFPFVRKPEER